MKKTLYPFLLVLLVAACQQQKPATVSTTVQDSRPPAIPGASGKPLRDIQGDVSDGAAPDSISPAMRAFAKRNNLSGVWQGLQEADSTGLHSPTVCDGFFGPDHYHIELVLLKVSRDAVDPLLYHVLGKDRYKRRVMPFAGTIRLRQLRNVSIKNFQDELQGEFAKFYTAQGDFKWQETGTKGTGVFEGKMGIDFQQQADSSLVVAYFMGNDKQQFAKGWQMYIDGVWTSALSGNRKNLLAAANIEGISQSIFSDFNVGERSFSINPKYAKLGWSEYWNNDEWWADSPKPSLNL